MNIESLLALIDTFYSATFELEDAKKLFGARGEPDARIPHVLPLATTDPEVAAASLETVDPVPPSIEPLLAGVVVRLVSPLSMRFADFARRFGPPREMPRLKPRSPLTYQFLVEGRPRRGYLLLALELGQEDREPKRVREVVLRRFRSTA